MLIPSRPKEKTNCSLAIVQATTRIYFNQSMTTSQSVTIPCFGILANQQQLYSGHAACLMSTHLQLLKVLISETHASQNTLEDRRFLCSEILCFTMQRPLLSKEYIQPFSFLSDMKGGLFIGPVGSMIYLLSTLPLTSSCFLFCLLTLGVLISGRTSPVSGLLHWLLHLLSAFFPQIST